MVESDKISIAQTSILLQNEMLIRDPFFERFRSQKNHGKYLTRFKFFFTWFPCVNLHILLKYALETDEHSKGIIS